MGTRVYFERATTCIELSPFSLFYPRHMYGVAHFRSKSPNTIRSHHSATQSLLRLLPRPRSTFLITPPNYLNRRLHYPIIHYYRNDRFNIPTHTPPLLSYYLSYIHTIRVPIFLRPNTRRRPFFISTIHTPVSGPFERYHSFLQSLVHFFGPSSPTNTISFAYVATFRYFIPTNPVRVSKCRRTIYDKWSFLFLAKFPFERGDVFFVIQFEHRGA